MNRAKGKSICAVATVLILSILVLNVAEGQTIPQGIFTTIPVAPKATEPFNVTLTVLIDQSILSWVYGDFSVLNSTDGSTVLGPKSWSINFDGVNPRTTGNYTFENVVVSLAGNYNLSTDINWTYVNSTIPHTINKTQLISVAPPEAPDPSYAVIWLQKPDGPIRAGKLIRLRFSIQDASGSFVPSDDVRIVVKNNEGKTIVQAECGRRSTSIRINADKEYYRWYWKTGSDLPEGAYDIIVLLDSAVLSRISITIVPKI